MRKSEIKTILVTGSSGTIGTRLCEKLLEEKYEVIGVDWRKNKWSKAVDKLTINIDLRDKNKVFKSLPKNVDLVVHLAANARVYNLVEEPSLARDNFETTFNTLEFCRKNGVKNFILASSRETYGNAGKKRYYEKDALIENCESPYSASKIGGETLCWSYWRCYGTNFVIFRFSNVYGMYDESDRVVPLFIRQAKKNKDLIVYGKDKFLDFTYIDDAISGVISGIKNFKEAKNNVINIASGKSESIVNIARLIKNNLESNSKIVIKQNRIGEVVRYIADISKAKKILNYNPKVSIREGILMSVKWYEHF